MITEFVADLARLRQEAGQPSLRRMAEKGHYSHTALSSVLSGKRLPSQELTMAFVRACDGDESVWRARWEREHAELNPPPAPAAAIAPARRRPAWWTIAAPVALSLLLAAGIAGYLATRPAEPTAPAAPVALDGTDPQEQHCQADAVSVHTEPVPGYGSLTLRHSPHCRAVWPLYVSTEQVPPGVTISLRAVRPADGAESRFDYPYMVQHQVYSVFGNILATGRGCVEVTIEISSADPATVLARAATPCLSPA
ncbi:DUF2690 domain-containing protein [Dactylosporangium vinaceum]|uniref:DUF2690 domain-containing protein n=1 Tax=Dactylosporangium vinaceum TaxID=53362 RepID=A0ABV5M1Z3_9ACTN|nr:DUF2690 domain-containing protein [Dactylosporangium vinaceum]UAB99363.1 DUF2690 domain-containing protein [Dactylosporangium vinaceum]